MSNREPSPPPPDSRDIATYLGHRIRTLREARGMNINQLADGSGVSYPYLRELEDGEHASPGLGVLLKLLRGLKLCSLEELTGGTAALLLMAEGKEQGKW